MCLLFFLFFLFLEEMRFLEILVRVGDVRRAGYGWSRRDRFIVCVYMSGGMLSS